MNFFSFCLPFLSMFILLLFTDLSEYESANEESKDGEVSPISHYFLRRKALVMTFRKADPSMAERLACRHGTMAATVQLILV